MLEFHSGAVITATISFDVYAHGHKPIELYGTEGSLQVPDPNTFGGPVNLWPPTQHEWKEQVFSHPYATNVRSIGAADLAMAILSGGTRAPRASGALAFHALEVMHAFEASSNNGGAIDIQSRPEQPAPLPLGLIESRVV